MYQWEVTYPDGSKRTYLMSGLFPAELDRARKAYEAQGCTIREFMGIWR